MEKISILVIDDDDTFRKVISKELREMGFEVDSAAGVEEAKLLFEKGFYDVVLLDIKMPGMNGIDILKFIKTEYSETEVIMLTGYGTLDNAVTSMKLGAYDYLMKPCKLDELEITIKNAYEKKMLRIQNVLLKQELIRRERYSNIVGNSPAIRSVLSMIDKVAGTNSTVLIEGESGVGKELVAKAIHQNSPRKDGPFVVIDCGSLQENLLESELFGHEKGAYTGAYSLKHGLFEVADKGTIFMDEIGETSPAIQVKILRVLETGTFRRLGGTNNISVDVRIITATNRDLKKRIEENRFREDLFYRLNVFNITIPPLRARIEDIPALTKHFIASSTITEKKVEGISREALDILMRYHWPGNVRELENVIERAIILAEEKVIIPDDLPPNLVSGFHFGPVRREELVLSLQEIEERYIKWMLKYTKGHKTRAAKLLRIDPKTLYRKLTKYYKKS